MSYLKIQNDYLRLEVSGLGAELQSIIDQRTGKQYLWQADPAYWGRKSPLLFPIIGSLKDNEYLHQEKTYGMNKHGIVRDADFELVTHESDYMIYHWHNNSDNYPFACSVYVTYQLDNNSIIVSYRVVNEGSDELYYSIGGHPGFNVNYPVTLVLEGQELSRYLLKDSLISGSEPVEERQFELVPLLFEDDALIYSGVDKLLLEMAEYSIEVDVSQFDTVGIWSPYQQGEIAPFICVEPWQGLPDTTNHNKLLKDKKGIQKLAAQEEADFTYRISFNYEYSI